MSGAGEVVVTPTPAGTSWFGGYDADTQAHITGRGWDKLPVDQAVAQAVKAHREAEKLIGVPAEHVVRWPKDANDKENWDKVHARMGVPTDPKEYDFTGVKRTNGEELKPEFFDPIREMAQRLHLNKDAARELASDLVKQADASAQTSATVYEQKLQGEREALDKNWGTNKASNLVIAQNAAQKLFANMAPADLQAAMSSLEKSFGYANIMEMFRQIGTKIGEDKFVNRDTPNGGAMTGLEAQQKLDMLTKDTAWVGKYEAGDVNAVAEFNNLTRLIAAAKRA